MPSDRRDHLIETAIRLFCRDGFQATGIDTILAEAGVAKMTLYNHFRSKDDLILAALRRRDERWRAAFERAVEKRATDPRERLLAVFDILADRDADEALHGCVFINASAEYREPDCPIRAAAAEHKRLVTRYLRRLAADARAADPDELATELRLLIDGLIVMTQLSGEREPAAVARSAAAILIDAALASPAGAPDP